MNLHEKMNLTLKKVIDIPHNRTESGLELLKAIVACINEIYPTLSGATPEAEKDVISSTVPQEPFISVVKFWEDYRIDVNGVKERICTDGGLSQILRKFALNLSHCSQRNPENGRWSVQAIKLINILASADWAPKVRGRCEVWLQQNPHKKIFNI